MKVTFLKEHTVVDGGAKYAKGDSVEITPDSVAIDLFAKGVVTAYVEPAAPVVDIKATVDAAVATQIKALGNQTISTNQTVRIPGGDDLAGEKAATVQVGDDVLATDKKGGFKTLGHFVHSVYSAEQGKMTDGLKAWSNFCTKAPTGASLASDSNLGFLVPESYASELLEKTPLLDPVLGARRVPFNASNIIKYPYINETSRADGSRQGGIRVYRTSEGGTMTSSNSSVGMLELKAKKLTGLCYATDELLRFSPQSIEPLFQRLFQREFGFKIVDEMVRGDGASQMLGVLNAACTVSVSKDSGQTAATITFANVKNMWARLHPAYKANAAWLVNVECMPQLQEMYIGLGTSGQPVYMPPGGISGAPYGTIFGRPVIESDIPAALGTVGDIILGAWSEYLYAEASSGIESSSSMHIRFLQNETAFRFVMYNDGMPWWNAALTPYKGSSTLSPFVTLATRS